MSDFTVVWLFVAVDIRMVGEQLPVKPKDKKGNTLMSDDMGRGAWWLDSPKSDVIAIGRFDDYRAQLMSFACRSHAEANAKYWKLSESLKVPNAQVAIHRICESEYERLRAEDERLRKPLEEQALLPAYMGKCLDNRRVKR